METSLIPAYKDIGHQADAAALKAEILTLAHEYTGQGDPDFSKQNRLDTLVKRLLEIQPVPPVQNRLSLLTGVWKQVWGPYDYRHKDRLVDPTLEVNEIYQVIFKEGFYYNVCPLYQRGDRRFERIGLLRGEFKPSLKERNTLNVHFTNYPGVNERPDIEEIWDLAHQAETHALENKTTIVPSWIVRLFFDRGHLREVYTDHDLRLTYGSRKNSDAREDLYVLTKIRDNPGN